MKIVRVESWRRAVKLKRPYTVAFGTRDATELFFVRIITDSRHTGLGSGAPAAFVSQESADMCAEALAGMQWLHGTDPRQIGRLCQQLGDFHPNAPAARAAVGMALYDLLGKILHTSVVDLLGIRQPPRVTSMTIGIKSFEETLADCCEYLDAGFRAIKLKTGKDVQADIAMTHAVHALLAGRAALRVDANQGYSQQDAQLYWKATQGIDLEFIEQPLGADAFDAMRTLPTAMLLELGVDESLRSSADAMKLLQPSAVCRVFNIKLMKCGFSEAMDIGRLGARAGRDLMWGCMDESVLSLAAALHLAYANPMTRYLDLDGHFDLAEDPAHGGIHFEDGVMHLVGGPGLGVTLND